jgi:nucleotide-binding universal stress UspA family protein
MPAKLQTRVTFKNILFATDFSASANSAMRYAAGLARSFGAKLYAMHVQEPINYALPPEAWQSQQLSDEMEMNRLRDAVKHDFPEITSQVLEGGGAVWPALEAAIQKHDINLMVVGTRGRTGVSKALLGSRAEEILRRATCPVLTVGPHVSAPERARGKMGSILFATDFGSASLAAAPVAVSLAEEYQSKLTLLHVIDCRKADDAANHADFGESSEQQLRDLVSDEVELWCEPHFVVATGEPAEKILATAERTKADLIVLGVHSPEGVPGASTHLPISTVHKVVSQAECAVLTIRG